MRLTFLIACALVTFCVSNAQAQFDLRITEIWPGSFSDPDLTADWFEVTNVGANTYDSAVDGFLFFDDESQNAADAALLNGISMIAPGESVVFIDDADTTEFETVWSTLTLPQLGTYDGSGLSGGGDAVTLFIGPDAANLTNIGFEAYPATDAFPGQSYDVFLEEFSTIGNASGAVQSSIGNAAGEFAIASPGFSAIPEPSSAALILLCSIGVIARRRVK